MLVLGEALVGALETAGGQVLVETEVEEAPPQMCECQLAEVMAQRIRVLVLEEALPTGSNHKHPETPL